MRNIGGSLQFLHASDKTLRSARVIRKEFVS